MFYSMTTKVVCGGRTWSVAAAWLLVVGLSVVSNAQGTPAGARFVTDESRPGEVASARTLTVSAFTHGAGHRVPLANPSFRAVAGTEAILSQLVELPKYDDVPLADVLKDFEERFHLRFHLDKSAAEDETLGAGTLVSSSAARDMRLDHVLDLILQPHQCTIALDRGLVRIVSDSASLERSHMYTRVFDCGDLLSRLTAERHGNGSGRASPDDVGVGGGGAEHGTLVAASRRQQAGQELMRIISENTGSHDVWRTNGGEGSIDLFGSALIVTQRYREMKRVEELLEMLRQSE